jgi:hypothetical protein
VAAGLAPVVVVTVRRDAVEGGRVLGHGRASRNQNFNKFLNDLLRFMLPG